MRGSTADGEKTEGSKTVTQNNKGATRDPEKTIDLYLIAGQSNAAGSTAVSDREKAYAFAPELETGFDHILFSGKASNSDFYAWQKTTLGLGKGKNGDYFGPEAGMAKALSSYYNKETGNLAGFIKVAYGGTNLLNVTGGNNDLYGGNWVPPSYAAAKGYSYENGGITGGLYRNLLNIVRQQVTLLRSSDYKVNIKGLYWMQGEEDREDPAEYQVAFGYLARDLRRDLSEIMKEITGEDCGASGMPIFVVTFSKTFNDASESSVQTNTAFIRMQKSLPDLPGIGPVVIVDNSDYDINIMVGPVGVAVGSDQCHWNQNDQLAIGENVGKAMLAYYGLS